MTVVRGLRRWLADLDTNLGRLDEERASLEGRYRRAIADLTFKAVEADA